VASASALKQASMAAWIAGAQSDPSVGRAGTNVRRPIPDGPTAGVIAPGSRLGSIVPLVIQLAGSPGMSAGVSRRKGRLRR
jgi:hypothetical protein